MVSGVIAMHSDSDAVLMLAIEKRENATVAARVAPMGHKARQSKKPDRPLLLKNRKNDAIVARRRRASEGGALGQGMRSTAAAMRDLRYR
mgnify:CR=1 FL=1